MIMIAVTMIAVALLLIASFTGSLELDKKLNNNCGTLWRPHEYLNIRSGHYYHTQEPRPADYDHINCFLMKSRYNCAHTKIDTSALNYQFAMHSESGELCTVRNMFDRSGGIAGISKKIREWSHRRTNVVQTNVLLIGNSFLRQVYETIVCRYRDLITGGFVIVNGPDMSLAAMQANPWFNLAQMGERVSMESQRAGCHHENYQHFYEAGVQFPSNAHPNCSDDMSMVELPGNLRIYYIFRHFRFDADPTVLFAKLGLNVSEVDVVVTNNSPAENFRLLPSVAAPVIQFDRLLPFLRSKQVQAAGRYFGADNVGMVHVPDAHPCMPGIPDDETDIVLFQLAHKLMKIIM